MGDESLRCLGCQGKFGRPLANLRCDVCGLIFRLQDVIYSERFPALGSEFITPELRGVYYRALEVVDTYQRSLQGGSVPPRSEEATQVDLQTTPKAKPAVKAEVAQPTAPEKGDTKEEPVAEKLPEEEPKKKSKSPQKERKTKSEEAETGGRARSSGIRRRRAERSRSRRRRREERGQEETRGDSRKRSPVRREERSRSKDDRKERDREAKRSPLRPRSPSGPPPPREDPARRWQGAIPAYRSQGHHHHPPRYNDEYKQPENKGVKKRKQQAVFAEFKAWRKRNHRHQRW